MQMDQNTEDQNRQDENKVLESLNSTMEIYMREISLKESEKDMVNYLSSMKIWHMMENGNEIKEMVLESKFGQIKVIFKEIGMMVKYKREYSHGLMDQLTQENG